MTSDSHLISRRRVLQSGALVVSFAMMPPAVAQLVGGGEGGPGPAAKAPTLPGSLKEFPILDSWIRIEGDGHVTVFTGKAELGQGSATALWQVAAEELDLPRERVRIVTADTGRTPNEGFTAGSHSMQDSGTAIANAGANVVMLLKRAAAKQWSVDEQSIETSGDGFLVSSDGRRAAYGELAAGLDLHVSAIANAPRRDPAKYRQIGKAVPRLDIPAKLTGGQAYVQDMRLPGMLHARVLRGPSFGTAYTNSDLDALAKMPGVTKVVRNGSFLSVVAEGEWQAISALRRYQESNWQRTTPMLPKNDVVEVLKKLPAQEYTVLDTHNEVAAGVKMVSARYSRPWILHGSIGPSCAVALYEDGLLTVWTHTQGVFPLRGALAELLRFPPEKIRCIQTPGSGCYGHNGADDVAADAALTAVAMPGHPIRMQWMREQEFGWEPLGAAMFTEVEATLDAEKRIVAWNYDVRSNSHNTRPGSAGNLAAGLEIENPIAKPVPKPIPMPEGDGQRNSNPLYDLPNMHVLYHFVPDMPLRVSALRSLGAHLNVFSIESMMDELARAADADPLEFRLAHMRDARARVVMETLGSKFGWADRKKGDGRRGYGMAFARYKNLGAYCAVAMEIDVNRDTGEVAIKRVNAVTDAGEPINPDGIRNQIEGAIIQALSWTTREMMPFDAAHRTAFDWSGYPISRFSNIPESLVVDIVPAKGLPFLGAGEAGQGPASAAFANAIADATSIRMRDMPLSPAKLKTAIGAA
ncbi:nicotinate dehydrogenase subunit B [Nitrobacteraceae bacterium AZCC 2161]